MNKRKSKKECCGNLPYIKNKYHKSSVHESIVQKLRRDNATKKYIRNIKKDVKTRFKYNMAVLAGDNQLAPVD